MPFSTAGTYSRGTAPPARLPALLLVGARLRLDGDGDDRLRERHRLEHDRLVGVAERVPGGRVLEPDGGRDVAGRDGLDLLALVGVHAQQAADALLPVLRRVEDAAGGAEGAGVHAQEDELADVLVVHDLEGQR